MGAASLTTANDCSRETGLLSEEVMASWGNGREEARLLLESLALHIRQNIQRESLELGLPCASCYRALEIHSFVTEGCPQYTACDLTWHIQGCTKA